MARDDRGLMDKCPKCKTKISPGYSICLSCGYKFGPDTKDVKKPVYEGGVEYVSDTKVEEKSEYEKEKSFKSFKEKFFSRFSRLGYPGSIGMFLLESFVLAFFIVGIGSEGSNFFTEYSYFFYIIGIFPIILGLVGLYSIKREEWIPGEKSKKLKDLFPWTAIISIVAGLIGIIIYYVFGSRNPFTDFKSLYATPFLLVAIASGIYGVYKESIPIIDLIGSLIGGIWFFISIMPGIAYLLGLIGVILHGAP